MRSFLSTEQCRVLYSKEQSIAIIALELAILKYLPSTALVRVFAALALLGALAVFAPRAWNAGRSADHPLVFERPGGETDAVASAVSTKDSDGDGLLDWEEPLWKADPSKSDSDGDGTPDGKEVASRRDPARPAPGDSLAEISPPNGVSGAGEDSEPRTATESLAREFVTEYFKLRSQGSLTEGDKATLIENLVAGASEERKGRVYTSRDLSVSSTSSSDDIRSYANRAGDALSSATGRLRGAGSELELLGRAVETGRPDTLERLPAVGAIYADLARELSRIRVPADAAQAHLAMINAYSSVAFAIGEFGFVLEDPVRALVGVSVYKDATERLRISIQDLQRIFRERRISFTEGEGGFVLTHTP